MKKNIVFVSDGRNVEMMDRCIDTIKLASSGLSLCFNVLSPVSDLRSRHSITVIDPLPYSSSLGLNFSGDWKRAVPQASLYRLAIPVLPEFSDCDRVLFMDTDMLVCDSIDELKFSDVIAAIFSMDISNFEVALPQDVSWIQGRNSALICNDLRTHFPELSKKLGDRIWTPRGSIMQAYGNAGFAVWSLYRIRLNGLEWYKERVGYLSKILEKGLFWLIDQDFINVMTDCSPSISGVCDWISAGANEKCVVEHFAGFGYKRAFDPVYSSVMSRKGNNI